MKIIKSYLTNNECYRLHRNMNVKGLMLHSTATPQPKASVFINSWNKAGVYKCVHAFIQADGNVYQTLPWDVKGWHGGASYSNTYFIGVEMCEPSTIKYLNTACTKLSDSNPKATKDHVMQTYSVAVELFAHLCKLYNLNPLTDILSHKEGHDKGIASNHGDPEHLWSKYGITMDDFRYDVKKALQKPFLVRVNVSSLNIRKSPNVAKNNIVGQITDKGTYTIVDTSGSWGKLKSGLGWVNINSKYCQKL